MKKNFNFRNNWTSLLLIATAVVCLPASPSKAADGTWTANTTANWNDPTRWAGSIIADGQDATASFDTIDITGNRTVTINTVGRTLGRLEFADTVTSHAYTIAGLSLTLSTSSGTPTIDVIDGQSHIIVAPLAGTQGFTKTGGGGLRLGGGTTLTGPLTVNGGTLRADTIASFNGQTITGADGSTIYHNAAGTYAGNYNIIGDGVSEGDPGVTRLGAIRFAANGGTGIGISGTITLLGDAGISARGVTAFGATISGQITGNHAIRFNRTSTTASAGNGLLILSNTGNNWTGDTTLEDGILRLGASGVLPNGASAGNVIMKNGGTAINATIADTRLDLNGKNETINGLSHQAGSDLSKLVITNSAITAAALTLGDNNASGAFGGSIKDGNGTIALTKIGTGTQTLSGANTFTGNTEVLAGGLTIASGGSLANSALLTLDAGSALTLQTSSALNSGLTLDLAHGITLNLDYTGADTIDKLFIGDVGIAPGTYNATTLSLLDPSSSFNGVGDLTVLTIVPEPGSFALLGMGLLTVAGFALRRKK